MLKLSYFCEIGCELVDMQVWFSWCLCPWLQVSRILYSFATAFRRSAKQTPLSATATPQTPDSDIFTFSVSLEIKEDDGKGYFR